MVHIRLNLSAGLSLVKVTMTAACVHTMISLKVPDWVIQEIDKRNLECEGVLHLLFLWAGKEIKSARRAVLGSMARTWPANQLSLIWRSRYHRSPSRGVCGTPEVDVAQAYRRRPAVEEH